MINAGEPEFSEVDNAAERLLIRIMEQIALWYVARVDRGHAPHALIVKLRDRFSDYGAQMNFTGFRLFHREIQRIGASQHPQRLIRRHSAELAAQRKWDDVLIR